MVYKSQFLLDDKNQLLSMARVIFKDFIERTIIYMSRKYEPGIITELVAF